MNENKNISGINLFQKYLTVWVIICMLIGVLIAEYLSFIPEYLNNRFEVANISIPIAVLIWIMIYPMMMKVDFKSIKDVRKNPKGLYLTWIINWLIKPFELVNYFV